MAYIQGEGRVQRTLFPVVLDDLIPEDHACRVIDMLSTDFGCRSLVSSALRPLTQDDPALIRATNRNYI